MSRTELRNKVLARRRLQHPIGDRARRISATKLKARDCCRRRSTRKHTGASISVTVARAELLVREHSLQLLEDLVRTAPHMVLDGFPAAPHLLPDCRLLCGCITASSRLSRRRDSCHALRQLRCCCTRCRRHALWTTLDAGGTVFQLREAAFQACDALLQRFAVPWCFRLSHRFESRRDRLVVRSASRAKACRKRPWSSVRGRFARLSKYWRPDYALMGRRQRAGRIPRRRQLAARGSSRCEGNCGSPYVGAARPAWDAMREEQDGDRGDQCRAGDNRSASECADSRAITADPFNERQFGRRCRFIRPHRVARRGFIRPLVLPRGRGSGYRAGLRGIHVRRSHEYTRIGPVR
jgi:hypothetical protein